jgi:hypothetical protein
MAQLSAELATLKPNQQVPVGITKPDGSTATVTATLGTLAVTYPARDRAASQNRSESSGIG